MKIVLLTNKYPYPERDGSTIAVMSMLRAMVLGGHQVVLISLNTVKHRVEPDMLPADLKGKVRPFTFSMNTNITPLNSLLNLFSTRAFHVSRFFNKKIAEKIKSIVAAENPDIIQWEGPFLGEYLSILPKTKAKQLLRTHNIEHLIWLRLAKESKNPIKKAYLYLQAQRLKRFECAFAGKMDALLPISSVDAAFFQKKRPHIRAKVLPTALNVPNYPRWDDEQTKFDLLYLASFDWEPNKQGLDWFFEKIYPELLRLNPGISIAIGGRNLPEQHLRKQSRQLKFFPDVKEAQVFMRQGRVFMVPLLSGSGIRIKIVEALSMGVPLVSTKIGAEGIGATHKKELLEVDNESDFIQAISALLADKEKRMELSKNARQFALEHYDIRQQATEISQFYQQITA